MYRVIANGEDIQQNVVELIADLLTDIDILPTNIFGPGSTCIVIEDSSVWMLGTDRVWKEL